MPTPRTFALSAVVLSRLSFGAAPAQDDSRPRPGLLREAREGLAALAGMAAVRTVVIASGAMLLAAGLFNVAELPFVKDELDAGAAGFGALTAIYGLGFVAGSLSGSRGGQPAVLKKRFLGGLALVGAGFIACSIAPTFATALPAFAVAGIGNGLLLVYERLLIQTTVDDALMARVFGVRDGLSAWAFAAAFLAAGGLDRGVRCTNRPRHRGRRGAGRLGGLESCPTARLGGAERKPAGQWLARWSRPRSARPARRQARLAPRRSW